MAISEQATIAVVIFDLTGKALSTVRKTLDAGSHSIALPYRGAGIYLYKVKLGNSAFVIKGNSITGVLSESTVSSQSLPSNTPTKQAKALAASNDVILAVT